MRISTVLSIGLVVVALDTNVWGAVTVPDPGTHVVDRAAVFDAPTQQKLEGWLLDLQRQTTAQVKVLTVRTTDGEPFFDYEVRLHAFAGSSKVRVNNNYIAACCSSCVPRTSRRCEWGGKPCFIT